MSDIALYLDQDNELRFNVAIEGSKPGAPKYRLVFEGKNVSYSFNGMQSAPGEVAFVVPTMKNIIKEGNYRTNLEVMIDDRYFTPLTFDASFEESVKVTAESVMRPVQKKAAVSASIVTVNKAQPLVETVTPRQETPRQPQKKASDYIGTVDGKRVTAEDLRKLIRTGVK
jgi:hypothetical protein